MELIPHDRAKKPVRRIRMAVAIAAALSTVVITGCTNQTPQQESQTQEATGQDPERELSFAMVTHASLGDAFWDVVKSGGEQGGKDLGIKVNYSGDKDPTRQSQLIDNAVSQGVDGLIVSMANPDGIRASVEGAVKAGIPVITINSGLEQSVEFGALTHVGQSEDLAGEAAGKKMSELGSTKALCVIHEAGNAGLEDRCAGAKGTFTGEMENLQVNVSNLADARSTIQSKLNADPSIDGVLTLGSGVAMAAVDAQAGAKSDAIIGTFDLDSNVLGAIKKDQLDFSIDQQPYVQGYLPVTMLSLYNRNGNIVGGGQPVLSGPAFVTKDNVDSAAKFAERGTR